jgi:hypothetical protein
VPRMHSGCHCSLGLNLFFGMEDDDLSDLLYIASARRANVPSRPRHANVAVALVQPPVPAAVVVPIFADGHGDDILGDGGLGVLVAIAERPEKRHERRSWQLLEKARYELNKKRSAAAIALETSKRQRLDAIVEAAACSFPIVARTLGLQRKSGQSTMTTDRAALVVRLALIPGIRGNNPFRSSQVRSVDLAVRAALKQRDRYADQVFLTSSLPVEEAASRNPRHHVLSWQWDETSQRMRGIFSNNLDGEKQRHGKLAVQVMVQSGLITTYELDGRGGRVVDQQPFLCRNLCLQQQNADSMLEGMSRNMPLWVEHPARLVEAASSCEVLIISFSCDRAAPNYRAMEWFWSQLELPGMPENVLPFLEPCAAHGIALVKSRPKTSKALVTNSHSLSGLMRQWRFANALRDVMVSIVGRRLKVLREPRPDAIAIASKQLVNMLYADGDVGFLHKVGKDGVLKKTSLAEDLDAISDVFDLCSNRSDEIVHYCYVHANSPEHMAGKRVGAACCEDMHSSIAKMAVPVINFLVHRAWSQSAESRWTNVLTTLKRMAVGYLCHRLLPESIRELQAAWGVEGTMEAMLERLIVCGVCVCGCVCGCVCV